MDSNISTLKLQEKFQKQWELCTNRPVAKIFRGGGGGGGCILQGPGPNN